VVEESKVYEFCVGILCDSMCLLSNGRIFCAFYWSSCVWCVLYVSHVGLKLFLTCFLYFILVFSCLVSIVQLVVSVFYVSMSYMCLLWGFNFEFVGVFYPSYVMCLAFSSCIGVFMQCPLCPLWVMGLFHLVFYLVFPMCPPWVFSLLGVHYVWQMILVCFMFVFGF